MASIENDSDVERKREETAQSCQEPSEQAERFRSLGSIHARLTCFRPTVVQSVPECEPLERLRHLSLSVGAHSFTCYRHMLSVSEQRELQNTDGEMWKREREREKQKRIVMERSWRLSQASQSSHRVFLSLVSHSTYLRLPANSRKQA